jgi:Outer membrane lipoprotein-sorting protein
MKLVSVRERFQTGRAALLRGLFFWRRSSAVLPLLTGAFLLVVSGAVAETTNTFSDAEIQGRLLTQQLLEQQPVTNFTQTGVLKIRDKKGNTTNSFVSFQTHISMTDWETDYEAGPTANGVHTVSLRIIHKNGQPNQYLFCEDEHGLKPGGPVAMTILNGNQIMTPFAGSDFWIADLGLEFFHWPAQKILKKEFRRNCSCMVLESTNPNPSTNGYSRVVSWIDEESGVIVMAEAYDANGKLLKEFRPKDFKKVKGQWQAESLEIDNVQTGSRTRLEFDQKPP